MKQDFNLHLNVVKTLTIVYKFVCFQWVGLGEAQIAIIAFVWFFSGVSSQVAFQFESIRRSICAVWTLIENNMFTLKTHIGI